MLEWMGRVALELIGQGGLGHSFDPLTADSQDKFTQAIKSFACVYRTGHMITLADQDLPSDRLSRPWGTFVSFSRTSFAWARHGFAVRFST